MTPLTMSALTRRSFEEVVDGDGPGTLAEAQELEPALAGLALTDLVVLARDAQLSLSRQDEVFGAVVRSYRRGPTKVWGAILLEMLAPALSSAAIEVVAGSRSAMTMTSTSKRRLRRSPPPHGCRSGETGGSSGESCFGFASRSSAGRLPNIHRLLWIPPSAPTIMIDNPTPAWIYFPRLDRWVLLLTVLVVSSRPTNRT